MSYLGIRGFESILRGGIPERAEVLVLTPEGGERHLLGAHWVVEGLARGDRVLAVIGGEDPQAFLARLARMGIETASVLAAGSLVLVDWFTCWTQAVEGVQEANRTFRASRRPEDLIAAIDRAIPSLFPAEKRRAYIDILPLAYKALEEPLVVELLNAVRGVLMEASVTAVFAGDRTLPPGRIERLLQAFHAVIDTRSEDPEVLGFAVLGVGGVRLEPRYRRVRVREDGAALEAQPGARTFSCPICDARVPFDANRCPSCGTSRSEMGEKTGQPGLMNYLESLRGKEEVTGRVTRPPPTKPPAPGLTNGVGPSERALGRVNGTARGRVNGTAPGRVNGTAPGRLNGTDPKGRTNGLAPKKGMVNGTRGATTGITNGMTNGLVRARSGITNGLTNGSGFTNGLGSHRARSETRRARWKLYLVPLLAASLLVSPLLLQESPRRHGRAVDGDPSEWQGVPGYTQTPGPGTNPAVALTAYKIDLTVGSRTEPDQLFLFASVAGNWFSDTDTVDSLYVFLHTDAGGTGYRVPGFAADLMAVVQGSNKAISTSSLRSFSGTDPDNWTAWAPVGDSVGAASVGGNFEMSIPWATAGWGANPSILLMAEDGLGNRSYSLAFGPTLGAARATVRSLNDFVSQPTADLLAVEVDAFGAAVTVSSLRVDVTGGTAVLPTLPVTVAAGAHQTLTVRVDTTGVSSGTLVTAVLKEVEADHPVLVSGGPIRAYVGAVGSAPTGKTVDGWFKDWGPDLQNDSDVGAPEVDRDIDRFASNRTGGTLFLYVDVKGTILAGTPVPIRRTKWEPGTGAASTSALPTMRNAGEDVLRIYVDTDRNVASGTPIHGLRGADLMLQVDGIHGEITRRTAYAWNGGWQPIATPPAVNDERRLEASLPVPATGAIEVVYETLGWEGPGDTTEPSATRGVRATSDGGYVYEGRFTATFDPSGKISFAAKEAWVGLTLPVPYANPADAWSLEPTEIGVRFARQDVEVRFVLDDSGVRESLVFGRLGLPSTLALPLAWGEDTMFDVGHGAAIGILGGNDRVFDMDPPVGTDASGEKTNLGYVLDLAAHRLLLPLPPQLRSAGYPMVIDATTAWTLRDDGPTYKVGEQMGWAVAVGDFNGDGYADVLTGAPAWGYGTHTSIGYAYVYYGPFTADKTVPDVRLNGTTDGGSFGYAVAAGKFNNDNFWDVLVARHSILSNAGPVCIFYGSSSWGGSFSTCDVKFEPPSDFNNYGVSVAAGNVDNAYYDDVVVGSSGHDNDNNGFPGDGVVYVYKSPYASGADISTANYTLYPSSNNSGQLGKSLAIGKIDSDVYPDVVAGEPSYVISGCGGRFQYYKGINLASGSGNRFPNATVLAPSSGCGASAWQFGASIAVGKLNSDAYLDVIVGAPTKGTSNGTALLYLANSGGTGLTTGASPDISISHQQNGERFGTSVAIADLTNDNIGDAIVGAPFYDSGGSTLTGRVYWLNNPLVDQTPDATWTGSENAERFGQALAAGKFSNDIRQQVAIGAYLWDKNSGNPSDNDGRVVVAAVPEAPIAFLIAIPMILILFRSRWRPGSLDPKKRRPRGYLCGPILVRFRGPSGIPIYGGIGLQSPLSVSVARR